MWGPAALRSTSLRSRLVLIVALLLCGLCLPLLLALPSRMDGLSRRWVESRSVGIARLLAAAAAPALEFDDARGADFVLEKLGSSRDALWAVLLRDDGSRLASWRD